ncbi:Chondroitin synthase [Saliniradius amylolyticus]|uniref:Chondroitin synthase n=1 Tax=Saliniradius amylolyticus TaxID=2183582 RepID=A0A2S2E133_9ALTE|nr:glycosyltransferase [Saliniradius amylolyticus]AWL11242.1 Chondroitin synthase [Saliniradius amylolyticus]
MTATTLEPNKSKPLVSIYMPTHNRLSLLPRAVKSIQAQTFTNFEAIIVDDGSSDETAQYLNQLSNEDPRFRVYRHESPKGACAARNLAISMARGEYITGLDDDDEFTPDRLLFFWNNRALADKYGFVFTSQYWSYGQRRKVLGFNEQRLTLDRLLSFNYAGNQVFIQTEKLRAIGGFDAAMPACQDWDTWIRACQKYGDAYSLNKPTYITHTEHELGRISVSKNKVLGHEKIIEKYAGISSRRNARDQKFLLCRARREKFTIFCFIKLATLRNWRLAVRYLLSSNFPYLSAIRLKILKG